MNRRLAVALVLVMLGVVAGQAWWLSGREARPVTQIELHPSRLVAFLQEIRADNPLTYDSVLLNLTRLRDPQPGAQAVQPEEQVVAEQLLLRLTGEAPAAAGRPAP
jgi:hypothetical protein